jgi:integrase
VDQLQKLYGLLPSWAARLVRFAVHAGMRLEEILTLTWGNVDLTTKAAHVEDRYAKSKKARDVALGDVAASILAKIQPENPAPSDRVFLGRSGKAVRSIRTAFDNAVAKVWTPARPDEQKPRFHDLRKTGATRVEAASSHAVARAFLGHSDRDVTDSYVIATLEAVRAAVNRATFSVDGTVLESVTVFQPRAAHQTAQQDESAVS